MWSAKHESRPELAHIEDTELSAMKKPNVELSLTDATQHESQNYELDAHLDKLLEDRNSRVAVEVDNISYSYGRGKSAVNALDGITINVPEGNIYSILGPSGCGKTTLVHCLVGSLKASRGCVRVFGHSPGSSRSVVPGPGVGYMPQEIGLFPEFTIEETLTFFGRLYRLPKAVIRQSIQFLLTFLDLPDKSRIVGNLSGGQKRRVSLAAALVHKPPLLILDEPTVGIDPVLRHSIWKHLTDLAKDGITVVITTHYVEEARSANTVAFMRQGLLLIEDNPESLLKKLNLSNLEKVFLYLCSKDKSNGDDLESSSLISRHNQSDKSETSTKLLEVQINDIKHTDANVESGDSLTANAVFKQNGCLPQEKRTFPKRNHIADHFARTSSLFWKNATRMFRNLPVLIFTLIVPSIQGILFFFCVGRDPYNIPVAVYNEEFNNAFNYSTKFLQKIDNYTIHLKSYDDFNDAIMSVKNGENRGLIAIGANFSVALVDRSDLSIYDERILVALHMSKINLYLDMTTQFAAHKITQAIHEAFEAFTKDLLKNNDLDEAIADPPIHIHTPVLGTKDPPVTQFMAPGFILSLLFLSSIAPTALTLVLERKDGLLERSLVAGVHPYEYIMSHVLTQVIVVTIQVIFLLVLSFVIFDIPCRGSIFWVSLLVIMQGVCGMTYGLFISALCREENSAFILCMGSMFPQFLMSGTVWPMETMPKILVIISSIFPQGISIDAVRHILYRGWGPEYLQVALGYIISGIWTLVFLFGAGIIFSIKKSN